MRQQLYQMSEEALYRADKIVTGAVAVVIFLGLGAGLLWWIWLRWKEQDTIEEHRHEESLRKRAALMDSLLQLYEDEKAARAEDAEAAERQLLHVEDELAAKDREIERLKKLIATAERRAE